MRARRCARRAGARALACLALLAGACDCGEPCVDRSDGTIPELTARRLDGIELDGRLDEASWTTTGTTGPFVAPGSGRQDDASGVPATARIGWDDARMYVGVTVGEEAPSSPFSPDDEDPHLWERASAVELMVQPGDPGNNTHYYEVQVDVEGAVWDTRFDDYNAPITGPPGPERRFGHQQWKSYVETAIHVDDAQGQYVVELALPWRALESPRGPVPPEPGDVWRVNLYSFRDGQRDSLAWSPVLGEGNFHRASRFGRVRFGETSR